ncbi:retrovirus-related pol polyprotein from transposon TNT 1-94 [Tanacetum coccineum]
MKKVFRGVRFWIKIENEQELSYEILKRVDVRSYEHYKGVGAEVEHPDPGFELQLAKMVEMGHFRQYFHSYALYLVPGALNLHRFTSKVAKSGVLVASIEAYRVYKVGAQFEKLVNASKAKKLEKSHDPLALVAHTGLSSRQRSSYYVTHPTSVVDYDDEYQQDDVHNNSEDPLVSAMLLLEKSHTHNFSNPTNNRNTSTVQCYNCSRKGHYAMNCPKPRACDSKYFMEQILLAKQDEACVILTDEQNDFLFADASRMEEIEELSANICLMVIIQPTGHTFDDGPRYESAFISEVQSSSIDENNEPMYPTYTKIINSSIGDDQINSNIKFDSFKGNVNSGSVEKDTHVPDLCAVEKLARNAYKEAKKQQIFAQQVQKQNTHLTSQLEMYKERVRILENINKDNNYLNEFLEADEWAKRYNKQAQSQLVHDREISFDISKNTEIN